MSLINNHVCSDCFTNQLFPHLSPFPLASLFWDTTVLKLGPVITQQWTLTAKMERRSLTLNKNLEMIKLSEKGILKAKIGQKLGLLCQIVSQVMSAKKNPLKQIKTAASVNTWMIRWNSRITDMEKVYDLYGKYNTPLSQGLIQSEAPILFNSMKVERWGSCGRKVWS